MTTGQSARDALTMCIASEKRKEEMRGGVQTRSDKTETATSSGQSLL